MISKYWEELKKIETLPFEEEQTLWRAMAHGDEEARGRLIISYQPLVFKTAASFRLPEEEFLELVQEGMVGIIEAVERFEYERGVAFSLFAIHRVRGRMADYLRNRADGGLVWLDSPLAWDGAALGQLASEEKRLEAIADDHFLLHKVTQLLPRLPENEQKVLRGLYLDQVSPGALAQAIRVSRAHIYRLQKQGVKRLRGMLAGFIHELKW